MSAKGWSPERIIVSPDKFKGSLTASEAASAIREGVLAVVPDAEVRLVPIADGGEGTVDAAVAVGAVPRTSTVRGPADAPVRAVWSMLSTTAVIELAAASGLAHVQPGDRSARTASTFGTGQLILDALDAGATEIILGLGGSASTDGGAGLLTALGARFLDDSGTQLPQGGDELHRLARVDLSGLDDRLADIPIKLCCDVSTALLGPNGAAAVFAPQKGATQATAELLERGLTRLSHCISLETGRDAALKPWGGAAGGTAGGLYGALNASFAPGVGTVADLIDLNSHLRWGDLLLVGEGSLDHQSLAGKAPIGAARRARGQGIPAAAIAGRISLSRETLRAEGIISAISLTDLAGSPESAQRHAASWAAAAAETVMRSLATKGLRRNFSTDLTDRNWLSDSGAPA